MSIPGAAAITATSRQENSTLWKPISQFFPPNGTLNIRAQGIKFQASIPFCNAALSTLKYGSNVPMDLEVDTVFAHITIVVDDLGNFGCFNDCSTPQSVPLLATSTIDIGQKIPTILADEGISSIIGTYDNLKAIAGVTVGIVLLVVVVMATSICVGLLEGVRGQRKTRLVSASSALKPKKLGSFLLDSMEVAKKVGNSIFGPDYTSFMRLVVLQDKIDHVFKYESHQDDDHVVSASTVNDIPLPIITQCNLETEDMNSLHNLQSSSFDWQLDSTEVEDTETRVGWPPVDPVNLNSMLPILHGTNEVMRPTESSSSMQDKFCASPYNDNVPLLHTQNPEIENWSPWSSFRGDSSSDESTFENPSESSKDCAIESGYVTLTETLPYTQTFQGNINSPTWIVEEETTNSSDESNKTIGTKTEEVATLNEDIMVNPEGSSISNESKDDDVAPVQAGPKSHSSEGKTCEPLIIEELGANLGKDEEHVENIGLRIVLALSESTNLNTEEIAEAGLVFMSLEQDEKGSYVAVLAPKVDEVSSCSQKMDHLVG